MEVFFKADEEFLLYVIICCVLEEQVSWKELVKSEILRIYTFIADSSMARQILCFDSWMFA